MKTVILIMLTLVFLERPNLDQSTVELTVTVNNLRNSKGIVQFALYNKDGTIPDEDFKKYYKMEKALIKGNSATVVFSNLPKGDYAVNILHDENENGKIEKGFLLPEEGIGFSNFGEIGFGNKPNFKKANFELQSNTEIEVKVVYF